MDKASATRQDLEALGKLPEGLTMALKELQQDLQPPGLVPEVLEVSHATVALCWSLQACRRASEALQAEVSAIRSSLKPAPVTENDTGQEAREDQNGHEGEEEQQQKREKDEAGIGEAGSGATLQDRVASRDDLRARLAAHLRDALKMARMRIKVDLQTTHGADDPAGAAEVCTVDDIEHHDDGNDADEAGKTVDGKPGTSAGNSCSTTKSTDDLESALRCLAEWYRQSAARCDLALKSSLAVLDDDQDDTTGAAEPSSARTEAAASSGETSHQDDGSSAGLKDPFFDHEGNLERLLSMSRDAKEAVDAQQQSERNIVVGLTESTDDALQKFRLLLDRRMSLQPSVSQDSSELTAAAEKFTAAADREENYLEVARLPSVVKFNTKAIVGRLRWACEARHSYLSSMAAKLNAITEDLALMENKLCDQSAALDSEYPPAVEKLQEWERSLCEAQEGLERAELDLKFARRRGRDTAELEAKALELRASMKAERLDVKIMRERTRLYAVAWEHFPELLAAGRDWARLVGLDAASDDQAGLRRRGLLAEGRSFADFARAERRSAGADDAAAGSGRVVYEATDDQGRHWALKEYSLLNDRSRRALWRHVGVLDDLRHPKLACVCAVFEDPARGSAYVQVCASTSP